MTMTSPYRLTGACHCGRLHVQFDTKHAPASVHPRACDCSFCRKHQAAYVSDNQGRLTFIIHDPAAMQRYQQGSEAADFMLCNRCGVLLGVVFSDDQRIYGAVNYQCLDERDHFATEQIASPQTYSADEKLQCWRQLWTPNVAFVLA